MRIVGSTSRVVHQSIFSLSTFLAVACGDRATHGFVIVYFIVRKAFAPPPPSLVDVRVSTVYRILHTKIPGETGTQQVEN